MIKIIRMGTKQTKECTECGCYFSFDEEDVKKMTNINIGDNPFNGTSKFIYCPQCKHAIALEAIK